MTTTQQIRLVSVGDLRAALTDGAEIALIDIREGDAYAGGHISVAVPIPDSELELQITERVPRRGVRLVVAADDGAAAEAAAARLAELGYRDVRALDGGVPAWAARGNELITGLNSLSKALGEFVERRYATPRITVDHLKQKLAAGADLVVLDTRPLPEYRHIAIPGGRPAPGAELLYRVFDTIDSERTQIVVNCAGRTRAIIGAQALINAGITNPVVALENGTSAWLFAGYEPVPGADDLIDSPSPAALRRATEAAERIRRRFGVLVQGREELARLQAESEERTLYLFDVRTPDEYAEGHLSGAVSAPGGQLVQATDLYIGTRHARVVLVDTPDLVRSSITASWLLQLGLDEVYVHAASPQDRAERGAAPIVDVTAGRSVATVTPADLSAKLAAGEPVTVIDLQPPAAYFETRRYLPGSVVARRSTLLSKPEVLPGPVALVSGDGRLARLAAGELADLAGQPVWALDGGVDAWSAAGYPTGTGTPPPLTPGDTLPPQPDLESRKAAFAEYVAWGDRIIDQLERDGLVSFREFNEVDSLKPVQVGSARLRALIDHIDAGVVERDQQTRPPFAEFALLKQARIGALRLPAAEGGGDATLTQLFATVIDLAEADPNVAHSLRNHYQFVESLLRRPRASDVRWFDHVRSGRLFGLAATELGNEKAGRRNQQFRTAVTSTTAGLRLSGVKFYSTGNLYADLLVVAAQGPDDEPARIIVPVDRPGVVVERDWDGIGQRFTGSGTTRFDNVPVYQDDFVQPGSSYGDVPYLATFPQLYLTAIIAGILRRVARDAADLVRAKKRTFYHAAADQPTEDPILQQSVGYLASQAYVAEAAVLTAAAALEAASDSRGGPDEADLALRAALRAAKAKVVVDEQAVRAASELFDVGGGTAVRQVSHLDRHWRNIRTLASHNPRTYKAKAVGAYEISGTPLPNGAFF